MVMCVCIIYDKYWVFFFGCLISIKSQDIGMDFLQSVFLQFVFGFVEFMFVERDVIGEIYEQLIELMDFVGCIVEIRDYYVVKNGVSNIDRNNVFVVGEVEDNVYFYVVNFDC